MHWPQVTMLALYALDFLFNICQAFDKNSGIPIVSSICSTGLNAALLYAGGFWG